jgi:3-oxoisoapionate kinase
LKSEGYEVVFFDTLDGPSIREVGRCLWESRESKPSFVAGSSGLEYALIEWWQAQGLLPPQPAKPDAPPVDRLLVVSGSCSPGTGEQIRWALQNGFTGIGVDARALIAGQTEYARVRDAARDVLSRGGSPIIYSAAGPQDIIANSNASDFGQQLGSRLGALAGELVRECRIRRTLIAGGDTSGHAGRALRIHALTLIRPFAPGSPLCRIWSTDSEVDGGEILLKGGQVGSKTLFNDVRKGG